LPRPAKLPPSGVLPLSPMPFELHDFPASVLWKIAWPASSLSVERKASFAFPPASQGRSPSWHCGVPVGQVFPPSCEEKSASLARSMPVL